MKHLLILIGCLIALNAAAQDTPKPTDKKAGSDTSRFKIGSLKFTVVDTKGHSEKSDSAYKDVLAKDSTKHHHRHKATVHWAGFELGFNGFMTSLGNETMPKGYEYLDVRTTRLATVNLNLFEKGFPLWKHYLTFVTGLGIEWNNYYFRKDFTLVPGIDSVAGIYNTNSYSVNKLTTCLINIPLILELNTSKNKHNSFHLAGGIVAGYMYDSYTKQMYEANGAEFKFKVTDSYNLASFRYSAMVRVGYGKLNFFANYALSDLFKKGRGPELHAYSIGMTIIGF